MAGWWAQIDWGDTGSMLGALATLVGSFAVMYATYKGSSSFDEWRRQKREERRMAVAEDILAAAYSARSAIQSVRSPAMWGDEQADVFAKLREDGVLTDATPEGTKGALATAQAAIMRVQKNAATFDRLRDLLPIANAIFGSDLHGALEKIWQQPKRVIAAARSYAYGRDRVSRSGEWRDADVRRWEQAEAILWDGGDLDTETDQFSDEVDARINDLEQILLPIIRSK